MLRRTLSVAAAAAALLAFPAVAQASTTSTTPPTSYTTFTTVNLADGTQVTFSLSASHGPGTPWSGGFGVSNIRDFPCNGGHTCQASEWGQAQLGAGQVYFDPNLARAWSAAAPVALQGTVVDLQTFTVTPTHRTVWVRSQFTGTGTTTWTSATSNQCPMDGSPNCKTFERDGYRNATAAVRFAGKTATGTALLQSAYLVSVPLTP